MPRVSCYVVVGHYYDLIARHDLLLLVVKVIQKDSPREYLSIVCGCEYITILCSSNNNDFSLVLCIVCYIVTILDIIFVFLDKVDKLSFILLGGTVDPRFKLTHSKKEVYKTNMET